MFLNCSFVICLLQFKLRKKLQGPTLEINKAYRMVEDVRSTVAELRNDKVEFDKVCAKATQMV